MGFGPQPVEPVLRPTTVGLENDFVAVSPDENSLSFETKLLGQAYGLTTTGPKQLRPDKRFASGLSILRRGPPPFRFGSHDSYHDIYHANLAAPSSRILSIQLVLCFAASAARASCSHSSQS